MKLSILDQSPISEGSDTAEALENTRRLAKVADQLGFTRYWVAEHHSTSGLASTSPEVLIPHLATMTTRIRFGSGGVLLPQYSPYKVAENFKLLEALFPGRIDLGVGRSPGGGETIRLALTDGIKKNLIEFPRQLTELQGFLDNNFPIGHDYRKIKTSPVTKTLPATWVLGLSSRSAKHAAHNSTGFTYGHFIHPHQGQEAIATYLEHFQPSERMPKPAVNACVFVICAETEKEAEKIAISQDLWLLAVEKGRSTKVKSIAEAKRIPLSSADKKRIIENRQRTVIGSPNQVKKKLLQLADAYQTDEIMVITNVYDFEDKLHSYELLAETFDLRAESDSL
ncbi:LLM class flavin-dependent oxidoreductase [Alteribacillus iranensis]|uniref:Luciferase family oxidoreductase, group 1 n=1 Tax=Alteribacillus iranensis TaxID=930128 RepID=A0A1I2B275_9BACI|nr:LLM class flavin-dependent oxidoreductase [Alteribacillus iranensis]SFE50008.1 luciferase family oxidoreductase, group 1 [Alteribacillus iranensis]